MCGAGACAQCTVDLSSIRDGSNVTDSSNAQLDTTPYASLRDVPNTILAATVPGKFRIFLTLQMVGHAAVPFGLDKQNQLIETLTEVQEPSVDLCLANSSSQTFISCLPGLQQSALIPSMHNGLVEEA